MQKIRTWCEHCSTQLSVPESAVGKRIRCPKCQGIITIQNSVSPPPSAVKGKASVPPKLDATKSEEFLTGNEALEDDWLSSDYGIGSALSDISAKEEWGSDSYSEAPPDPKRKKKKPRSTKGSDPATVLHPQSIANDSPDPSSKRKIQVICGVLIVLALAVGISLVYRNESAKVAEKARVAMLAEEDLKEKELQVRRENDALMAVEAKNLEDLKEKELQVQREKSTLMFAEAKSLIEGGDIVRGVTLLEQYVSDSRASDFKSASQLLEETKRAASDVETCDWLKSLSDEDFLSLQRGERIQNQSFKIPSSIAIRDESIKRNLPTEVSRREAVLAEMRLKLAKDPLKVFLGGEISGTAAAFFRMTPVPQMQQVDLTPKNVFEKAELQRRGLESQYVVNSIPLAPGAQMSIALSHYPSDSSMGPHSLVSWSINLARPPLVANYKAVILSYEIGGGVETVVFQHDSSTVVEGITLEKYTLDQEMADGIGGKLRQPADKILKRMLSAGRVSYQLSTGPKEVGLVSQGVLSSEAATAIAALLQQMKLRNFYDKPPYVQQWMAQ